MTRSPRDRPSAAEKKERQVRTGQVDRGMAVPANSADLVNLPQDFSLNSSWQRPARQCTNGFNVRASLFVGPRLSVVFPEGVRGVPWRYRARLPATILVEGRAGTKGFNVRASLFVGPRLSVVFPQGVHGVPWRRRARLPVSDPCGSTCRSFYTRRTTSSSVPSRPDARPMPPWQEIPRTLPPSVPFGFQGSQPPSG